MNLDFFEAREVLTPSQPAAPDVQLSGLPAVGGGMVQGPTDDEPWKPGGYVPESGTVQVLTVDGHPRSLESPPAADLGPLASRVSALESTVNTGSNRNSALRSAISALESTVDTGPNRNSLLRSDLTSLTSRVASLEADTNWVSITPNSGINGTVQYRRYLGRVYLRGRVTRSAGWGVGSYTPIVTLPSGYRPSDLETFSVPIYDPVGAGQCAVSTAGTVSVRIGAAGPIATDLAGVSFFAD